MGWKSNSKVHFSKQMFLFHLFFPVILRYVKKCTQFSECYCYYIPYIFSIFHFRMLKSTERFVLEMIKHTERKKNDLNVTLHLKFSQEIVLITIILD